MKRQTRKLKKLPLLWAETTDFEVAIRLARAIETDPELEKKIILLPLHDTTLIYPPSPPMAA